MRLPPLLALALLAAAPAAALPSPPYLGRWDCEVAQFTFTERSYDAGDGPMPVEKAVEDDGNYHLFFAEGYSIWLSGITETEMTWLSDASGDSFSCTRLP